MKIKVEEALELAEAVLQKLGYKQQDALLTARHLVDSELRGYGSAGLARILSIRDRLQKQGFSDNVKLMQDLPAAAQLDGNDTLGYIVAEQATEIAVRKAKQTGIAVVGAKNTWYTGMLAYYGEMATREDLVAIIASNCSAWVAPADGYRPMFGTNPFAVAFPSGSGAPIIYDIGTSKILHADILLANRLGTQLPPESAYNVNGEATVDPLEALSGAMAPWGGHRGAGLAITVQLLGVLAGSPALPKDLAEFGYLIIVINPAIFRPIDEFKAEIDSYSEAMRQSPPRPGNPTIRMPYERSAATRAKAIQEGEFEVGDRVVEMLQEIIAA